MNRNRLLLFIPLIALAGWFALSMHERLVVTPEGVELKSDLANLHRESTVIDFDILDEARPMDLIEMTLQFPDKLLELEGKPVRLVGFMAPYDSLNSMKRCMMFPTYVGCSFCTPPSQTQVVYIRQREKANGKFPFIEPPSDVSGILRLLKDDSKHEGHEDGFFYVIDEAIVTPYLGSDLPGRAPGHGGNTLDPAKHRAAELEEVSLEALALEVSELRELSAKRPLKFERISSGQMLNRVHEEAERAYPYESRKPLLEVFDLLGFFEEPVSDWVLPVTSLGLTKRLACVDETGELISVLDTVSTADPFTRLELVKEIADALARQHFQSARPPIGLHADSSRALEALRQGNKQLVAYRYSRLKSISPASRPPDELFSPLFISEPVSPLFDLWHWLPWETGPFFVEARTGATKALSRIDELFQRPPKTTRELFRPRLYDENTGQDLIPSDFADSLLPEVPMFVEQFGLGGLVPWMMVALPVDQAKSVSGRVLADRYALWKISEDGFVLLLETRWPDLQSALRFAESVPAHEFQTVINSSSEPFSVSVIRAETDTGRERLASALSKTIN